MFPPRKIRKPDRLDEAKGKPEEPAIKAEYQRIRQEVRSLTDVGSHIRLGIQQGEEFKWTLPEDAALLRCDPKDLLAVCRRMAKSRELKYTEYTWEGDGIPALKGRVEKWYVKREDYDAKKRGGNRGRTSESEDGRAGGTGVEFGGLDDGDEAF